MLVRNACEGKYISPLISHRFGCDNKGVVHHGSRTTDHGPRKPSMVSSPCKPKSGWCSMFFANIKTWFSCPFKCKMYHIMSMAISTATIHVMKCRKLKFLTAISWLVVPFCGLWRIAVISTGFCLKKISLSVSMVAWSLGPTNVRSLAIGVIKWDVSITMSRTLFPRASLMRWGVLGRSWESPYQLSWDVLGVGAKRASLGIIILCVILILITIQLMYAQTWPQHIIFCPISLRSAVFDSSVGW